MIKFVAVFLIVIFSFLSHHRNSVWKNEYTLWYDAVRKSPKRMSPRINLGNAYIRRGVLDRAEKEFLAARAIYGDDSRVLSGLCVVYYQKGLLDKAIETCRHLTEVKPGFPPGHNNLGVALMEKGLLDEAIREFGRTIQLDKNFSDAYANLGFAYKKKGMFKDAKQELEKSLELNPELGNARKHLREVVQSLTAPPPP